MNERPLPHCITTPGRAVLAGPPRSVMSVVAGNLVEPDLSPIVGQRIKVRSLLGPLDVARPRAPLLDQHMGGALIILESIAPASTHAHGLPFLVTPGIAPPTVRVYPRHPSSRRSYCDYARRTALHCWEWL